MIAIDTNLLVYAHREDSEWHAVARSCLVDLATSGNSWAIAWSSLHECLAIVTHPRIWTADRDFSLFPELKTRNPLIAK